MAIELKLSIMNGPMAGQKYSLSENMTCMIGRSADCMIIIPKTADPQISRHHCRIDVIQPDRVIIRDMHSQNGTFVNEQELTARHLSFPENTIQPSCEIKNGDIIRLGSTELKASLIVAN
ncbi:MAG: hypothetical protein A2X49_11705 [Lentisphaerae bacterium GWF2_52_8]|nr:MAG: hypothetical protein A2X49_11705 [Lentisphaerae bacterium GWF2_52_8]